MRCGMMAAEHINDTASAEGFDAKLRDSAIVRELYKVRNIRPAFYRGLWRGFIRSAIETVTMGKLPTTLSIHADDSTLENRNVFTALDRKWLERDLPPRDRLASVYFAATEHDEDQPVHLKILEPDICATRCVEEYGNPCTRFCPANVYEMLEDGEMVAHDGVKKGGGKRLQINSANCVHCKVCDIKDPYQIINWVTPQGGSGPNYQNL